MIRVEGLVKSYSNDSSVGAAVSNVGFQVEPGEVVTLLGPSGCGKTTTLRCIAGLETPNQGTITLGDRTVFSSAEKIDVSPDKRDIGMVFQSYAIWPHMTVGENVAFPLRSRGGVSRSDIRKRVTNALELVGLGHLVDRLAPNLSGGQQQRVALARAIVAEPDVLLLDEPLSNLDAKLRDDMRTELRSLQQRLGLTVCFVTHDQTEAMGLADTVILMRSGVIVETGTPRDLYEAPHDPYTAAFLGSSNVWTSDLVRRSGREVVVRNPFGTFSVPDPRGVAVEGRPLDLFFRRHNVTLAKKAGDGVATGTVRSAVFLGEYLQVQVEAGDETALLSIPGLGAPRLSIGDELHFELRAPLVFERDSVPGTEAVADQGLLTGNIETPPVTAGANG